MSKDTEQTTVLGSGNGRLRIAGRGIGSLLALIAVGLLPAVTVQATDHTWRGGGSDNDWNTTSNWNPANLPTSADNAIITNGSVLVDQTGDTCASLFLAQNAGNNGTITMNGGSLTLSNTTYVGYNGTGFFIQSNGTVTTMQSAPSLDVGYGANTGNGRYELWNGVLAVSNDVTNAKFNIGYSANSVGHFVQYGGTSYVANVALAYNDVAATGICELVGGTMNVTRQLQVGLKGYGLFTQSGGSNSVSGSTGISIGCAAGANGTYVLSNGFLTISTANEQIGFAAGGGGTFTQYGGTNYAGTSYVYVPSAAGATGTYSLAGGTLSLGTKVSPTLQIGNFANSKGTFNFGDTNGTGILFTRDTTTKIQVRGTNAASGTFQGWGEVQSKSTFENNGTVIANGYGTDRDLILTNFSSIIRGSLTTFGSGDGPQGTNGWYAQNHGRLLLPPFAVTSNTTNYWGETSTYTDLVNHVVSVFSGVTGSGKAAIALYAPERSDVPPLGSGQQMTAIWCVTNTGFTFTSATLRFRYDQVKAAALRIPLANLQLFQSFNSQGPWAKVAGSALNTNANTITANGLTSLGFFAVGCQASRGTAIWVR